MVGHGEVRRAVYAAGGCWEFGSQAAHEPFIGWEFGSQAAHEPSIGWEFGSQAAHEPFIG